MIWARSRSSPDSMQSSCDLLQPGLLWLRSFFFNQSSFFGRRHDQGPNKNPNTKSETPSMCVRNHVVELSVATLSNSPKLPLGLLGTKWKCKGKGHLWNLLEWKSLQQSWNSIIVNSECKRVQNRITPSLISSTMNSVFVWRAKSRSSPSLWIPNYSWSNSPRLEIQWMYYEGKCVTWLPDTLTLFLEHSPQFIILIFHPKLLTINWPWLQAITCIHWGMLVIFPRFSSSQPWGEITHILTRTISMIAFSL